MLSLDNGSLEEPTFARAFLQFRQAFLVTECGTRRRLTEEMGLSSASLPSRRWCELEPTDSDLGRPGWLVEALLSPEDGWILR